MREVRDAAASGKRRPSHEDIGGKLQTELVRRFQNGDRGAGDVLLIAHEGFIYQQAYRRRGKLDLDDAIQLAREGFLEGARRHDATRGGLLTVCALWIRERVNKEGHLLADTVRLPEHARQQIRQDARLFAASGDPQAVERALWLTACLSLDAPSGHEGATVEDRLPIDADPVDERIGDLRRQDMMTWLARAALALVSEREADILRRRFMSDPEELQSEIGASLGITRQRIQQIEKQAIERIRARLRVSNWPSFEEWIEHAPFLASARESVPRAAVVLRSPVRGRRVLRRSEAASAPMGS